MFKRFIIATLFCVPLITHSLHGLKVGIIVPLQHAAMNTIVSNIREQLAQKFGDDLVLDVQNAQGDSLLQNQIIGRMKRQHMDYIMPIGTATTQMTLSNIVKTPVIGVAADIPQDAFPNRQQCIAIVNDEFSVTSVLAFLRKMDPSLRSVGILYGNAEKNVPDIDHTRDFCKKHNMRLFLRKADVLSEIPLFAKQLAKATNTLIMLKDHMVVSSTPALLKALQSSKGCLVAMDDGSVETGAHFGLGAREQDIGRESAKMLIQLHAQDNPIGRHVMSLTQGSVFYNPKTFGAQKVFTLDSLKAVAAASDLTIDEVTEHP